MNLLPVVTTQSSREHLPQIKMMHLAGVFLLLLAGTLADSSRIRRQETDFIDLNRSRCKTPREEPGVCRSIRKCPPLLQLLVTQRQQTEVVDFLRKSVCGYEGLDPKVCCPLETSSGLEGTAAPPTTASTTTIPAEIRAEKPDVPGVGQCGRSEVQVKNTRVVGGVNATLGAWPWVAALGYQSSQGGTKPVFSCAGSLINNQYILTAAHCLASRRKLMTIRLGDLNLYDDGEDGASPVDAKISKTIIHEKYNPTTFTNDIGLIKLTQPVKFTSQIQPICLPLSAELRSKDFVNRQPFIVGWGSISYTGQSSPTLLELQLPVVTEAECKRAFETFKTALIDKRVICAGFLRGGKDACRGDSGGPLMDFNNQDKTFYQIGIVSYGYKCAEEGFPGIYTRVTEFADWILDHLAD